MERLQTTRRAQLDIAAAASERRVKEALGVLDGESWSVARYRWEVAQPQAGSFTTLPRMCALLAALLDEDRTRGGAQTLAFMWHAFCVVEVAAAHESRDLGCAWPLLGIPDPAGRPRLGLAPTEAAFLIAFHRESLAIEQARTAASTRTVAAGSRRVEGAGAGGAPTPAKAIVRKAAREAAAMAAAAAAAAAAPRRQKAHPLTASWSRSYSGSRVVPAGPAFLLKLSV